MHTEITEITEKNRVMALLSFRRNEYFCDFCAFCVTKLSSAGAEIGLLFFPGGEDEVADGGGGEG